MRGCASAKSSRKEGAFNCYVRKKGSGGEKKSYVDLGKESSCYLDAWQRERCLFDELGPERRDAFGRGKKKAALLSVHKNRPASPRQRRDLKNGHPAVAGGSRETQKRKKKSFGPLPSKRELSLYRDDLAEE